MNTKTDGISSGLVAVAWQHSQRGLGDSEWQEWKTISWKPQGPESERFRMRPLCVISDAEAIIAKLSSKDRYGVCDECGTPYSFDPTDGGTICVKCQKDKIAQKDAEIIEQCRINGMGAEREATLLGKVERQSAALKLAREALFDMQDSYAAVHGWKDSFVIAATTAIAAIDALGEVK